MAATFIPLDGRITSMQPLNIPLAGGEVMEIISPGTAGAGNNYQVTTSVLADFFRATMRIARIITSGATVGSPLNVLTTDVGILFNKTIGSASYAIMPLAASMNSSVLFKDLKGDADVNPITISFSGGELCDGLPTIVIASSYGWVRVAPVNGGSSWYQL